MYVSPVRSKHCAGDGNQTERNLANVFLLILLQTEWILLRISMDTSLFSSFDIVVWVILWFLTLKISNKQGRIKGLGVWWWEGKGSMVPFFPWHGWHCMSWQVLTWFTSKSDKQLLYFYYAATCLLDMHLKDPDRETSVSSP